MYVIYINKFTPILFLIALGFSFIELAAAFYNDYCDYDEDIRSARKDKWTTTGVATPKTMRNISFLLLIIAFAFLWFTDYIILIIALYYSVLGIAYSHPKLRLKRYNIKGYILGGSVWILILAYLTIIFQRIFFTDIFFILYCFFQSVYLVCQKDSSDLKDDTNLFLARNWRVASLICMMFAIFSSLFLFGIVASCLNLLWVWVLNTAFKIFTIKKIFERQMTRKIRMKTSLIELITPYLFIIMFNK
jgi:hypothetical protein